MKTILFVCNYRSPYGGNFIPSMIALEEKLKIQGFRVYYLLPEGASSREWCKKLSSRSEIIYTNFSVLKTKFIKFLNKTVKEYKIDLLYTHFGKELEAEICCLINRKLKGISHIHSDFSKGNLRLKNKINYFVIYRLFVAKTRFIGVSPQFVQYNKKKIEFVPNALSADRMSKTQADGKELRRNIGLNEDNILCEVFGWSPAVKGIDIAVKAVGKIRNEYSNNVYLSIVCGESVCEEKMKEFIRNNTEYSGNEDFLIFLKPTEDIFNYHKAADMLLLSSRSEGFPYALLEMMSLGKRCVISTLPGTVWATKYPCTFCYDNGDYEACAAKIKEAIEFNDYSAYSVAEKVKTDYSIDQWTEKVSSIINGQCL